MSVVVNGIEMPKWCKDCPFVKFTSVGDICPLLKMDVSANVEKGGKPNDCPLSDGEAECEVCNKAMQVEIRKRVEHIRQAENTGWHYSKATEPCPYP